MFMFITSVLKCIEVILFCGCSFCAYRSWLTLMHVLHLSMPTVHLNAFRRRRWHECHCPSCLIKYAGNAGRRGLHAQGRHLHPSLERGSLNTLLVLRALEFFVLQSLSGFCVFVCTESKASMYHGVGQPNFGPKLGGDFMVENSTGENQDRRTGTGPWQSAEMSDSTRGLVPCDPNFSKYASLQSDVAQLKMHRSTIGFNMFQYVSICFNMFQYVSIQSRRVDMLISLGSWVPVACCILAFPPKGAGIQRLAQQPDIPFHFWSWRRNLKLRLTWTTGRYISISKAPYFGPISILFTTVTMRWLRWYLIHWCGQGHWIGPGLQRSIHSQRGALSGPGGKSCIVE